MVDLPLLLMLMAAFSAAIAVSRRFDTPGWAYPAGIAVGIALLFVLFLGFTSMLTFGHIFGMNDIFPIPE
ncbi:MAG: hypothetical protein ACK5M4_13425 [Pseudorhodobacter sp.]